MSIELHILGPSYGESIIIRTPDGGWGVVDAYSSKSYLDSTQYLKRLGVNDLKFLCWTHPDGDHSDGLVDLMSTYLGKIEQFWMFHGTDQEGLFTFLTESDRKKFKAKADYWRSLYKEVVALKKTTAHNYELVTVGKTLLNEPDFKITAIAPSDEMVDAYNARLNRLLENQPSKLTQHNNDISVALLVSYGNTHIVLGGDVTAEGWRTALPRMKLQPVDTITVKASHHGSEGSYVAEFWNTFQQSNLSTGNRDIIVTPFSKQSVPLPTPSGLVLLKPHGRVTVTGAANNVNLPSDPLWGAVALVSSPAAPSPPTPVWSGSIGVKLVFDDRGQVLSREQIH